jgi:hypothetical protein
MSPEKKLHLIIKYGNQLAQGRDTIDEHRQVLKEHRAVWFGKMGAGIGKNTIAKLRKQIGDAQSTYLFLFQRSERINVHRGKIVSIEVTRPSNDEAIIPAYYAACGIDRQMKLWVKISSLVRVNENVLADYHTASSGKKALHTASKSIASVFMIAEGASTLDVW